jgi:hypothetical protein
MNKTILAAMLLGVAHGQQIQLITDGSFENITLTSNQSGLPTYNAGTSVPAIWYGTSGSNNVINGSHGAGNWAGKSGSQYAWAQWNASYSQVVNNTPEGIPYDYNISFDWASRGNVDAPGKVLTVGVYLNGTQLGTSQTVAEGTASGAKQTFTHSYSSSTAMNNARFEIRWSPVTNGTNDIFIDNVSFTVPEPSAALMAGLGTLALLRRRRA